MAHDPFTLNLFGGTALSGGFGVTALAVAIANDGDDDPDPTSPAPAAPSVSRPLALDVPQRRGDNFYLADGRGLAGSWKDRARDNIAAIRLAATVPD